MIRLKITRVKVYTNYKKNLKNLLIKTKYNKIITTNIKSYIQS